MGCDARIIDKNKPVKIKAMCATCGQEVYLGRPDLFHKNCYSTVEGYALDLYIEYENFERR